MTACDDAALLVALLRRRVVRRAYRLPGRLVPEEFHVATVWWVMIYCSGLRAMTVGLAHVAPRISY